MIRLLLWIKRHLTFAWSAAEGLNGLLFGPLYSGRMRASLERALGEYGRGPIGYRLLVGPDLPSLLSFLEAQDEEQLKYFRPHRFDSRTLARLGRNPSFMMLGAFDGDQIVGYFFLRCFLNREAVAGYIVDRAHQGRGISKAMCRILVHAGWDASFRVFATVSRDNVPALRSYSSVSEIAVRRELADNYVFFEHVKGADA